LRFWSRTVHDQPRGDCLALLRGERGAGNLGDLGIADPLAQLVVPDRPRYLMGAQAPPGIEAIARLTAGSSGR
jgi:hypothetical protein